MSSDAATKTFGTTLGTSPEATPSPTTSTVDETQSPQAQALFNQLDQQASDSQASFNSASEKSTATTTTTMTAAPRSTSPNGGEKTPPAKRCADLTTITDHEGTPLEEQDKKNQK